MLLVRQRRYAVHSWRQWRHTMSRALITWLVFGGVIVSLALTKYYELQQRKQLFTDQGRPKRNYKVNPRRRRR